MEYSRNERIGLIVDKERKGLFGFIKKHVSVKEDAEDILQEVFYRLTAAYDEIEYIEKITQWLYRTARNKIIDLYRKKKTKAMDFYFVHDGNDDEQLSLADILPAVGSSTEDKILSELIWEEIEEALSELPEEQREVFILNELEQMTFKEISELTKVPVNTLLSRKRYAVLYLREQLKELYKEIIDEE